ncbi:hypothetical protein WH43_07460 [Rheinheimera sp. KL1]|uniref:DUF2971 domain-containing protein n=1 Tax=Rheinheimera sp. KL1 TaxID=1635005 RepID=UPI0006A9715C|nr:DUF2971 domain-containing protein [Rheinheimera sp. KL1]KOO58683.1 hypothetical protein WH43_07460 [Rheinheimera sp. KL1]
MRLYKYYRPDFYFEKSLRYDEIFFASNEQLNDPHDLVVKPYFGDNKEAWKSILKSGEPFDTWNLSKVVDVDNDNLIQELNDAFKKVVVHSSYGISPVLDEKKDYLVKVFEKYLITQRDSMFEKPEAASALCVHFLKEKLVRGWDKRYYSCSFSKDPLEPQMWAHYGGGFRGCVLIYRGITEGTINLRPNIYIGNSQKFKFAEVCYQDKDKLVDMLDFSSMLSLIERNLLNKSSFWSYEKEVRLLLSESFGSVRVSISSKIPQSTKTQIYHHAPDAIEGVIFGSNCSESYKEKVTSMLAEKYSFLLPVGQPAFLTFESKLTSAGKVEISSGAKCIIVGVGSSQVMKQILENEYLDAVLKELGITSMK